MNPTLKSQPPPLIQTDGGLKRYYGLQNDQSIIPDHAFIHLFLSIAPSSLAKCEPYNYRINIELQRVKIQIDNCSRYHKELMDYTNKFYFFIYLINYFLKIVFFLF